MFIIIAITNSRQVQKGTALKADVVEPVGDGIMYTSSIQEDQRFLYPGLGLETGTRYRSDVGGAYRRQGLLNCTSAFE
jgi:hypothetical protein